MSELSSPPCYSEMFVWRKYRLLRVNSDPLAGQFMSAQPLSRGYHTELRLVVVFFKAFTKILQHAFSEIILGSYNSQRILPFIYLLSTIYNLNQEPITV